MPVSVERRARQTRVGERDQELLVVNAKEKAEGRFYAKAWRRTTVGPEREWTGERRKASAGPGTEKASTP